MDDGGEAMEGKRWRDIALVACGVAVLGWATWPPDKVALDEGCGPLGGPASFSAALYRGGFWRAQLDAVVAERNDLLIQPARRERIKSEEEREAREASPLESRMMRLSQDQNRVDDQAERERLEMARQSARLRRITWLMACEADIRRRLSP